MNELLDRDTLGSIATEAAAAMFSLQLEVIDAADAASLARHGRHSVLLRLHGAPAMFLGLACDQEVGAAIASVVFEMPLRQIDAGMIDDALRELANIFAGQVKSILAPEHQIGLPSAPSDPASFVGHDWHGVSLRVGDGEGTLDVAVAA